MSKPRERNSITDKIKKHFVRCDEGAELYSMSVSKFREFAKMAGAVYKVDRVVLVNCDLIEKYLEGYRDSSGFDEESEEG